MIFKNEDEKDLATLWGVQELDMTFDEYCQSIYAPIDLSKELEDKEYTFSTREWHASGKITAAVKKENWREFYKNEIEVWNKNEIRPKTGNHFYTDFLVNRFNNALTPKTKAERHDPLQVLSLKNCLTGTGAIAHFSRYYSTFKNEIMVDLVTKYNITSIIDPCSGWGERLLTCGIAGIKYTGIDINEALEPGYRRLIDKYNLKNISINFHDSATFEVNGMYDCLFSSPPYWDTEIYTEAGAENLSKEEFCLWWDTLVKNYKDHIKIFAYQIDLKHSKMMNEIIEQNGFELVDTLTSEHQQSNHFVKAVTNLDHKYRDNKEVIFVFMKPDTNKKLCTSSTLKCINLFED